jgi:hypothetical protein
VGEPATARVIAPTVVCMREREREREKEETLDDCFGRERREKKLG